MQIIPVLDVKRGVVVHARHGRRDSYQPISSILTHSTNPRDVIQALLMFYPFKIIYIADLDAIQNGMNKAEIYRDIAADFPSLTFWLDVGIQHVDDAMHYSDVENITLVLGSETLKNDAILIDDKSKDRFILSMDKKGDEVLENINLVESAKIWPHRILAMQLDNVGGEKGPAYGWIEDLMARSPSSAIYAAGGVRNRNDLLLLDEKAVKGALIASALHDGRLTIQDVKSVMEQEHCP